ncbi:MAG TPA: aspartyl protease family protein [Gemmatimonadaceae bacterium]|nr:aspartyl protease family protein [Gemmatimonadaceae bacterium]
MAPLRLGVHYLRMRLDGLGWALSGCLLMSFGCAHRSQSDLISDTGPEISVRRMRVRQHGIPPGPTFWNSVSELDVTAARVQASTVSERFFTDALSSLVNGDLGGAEVLFHSLLADPDPLVRGRARIGLTVSLNAQGKWQELAALPPEIRAGGDTVDLIDRAAVDSWAGVLRNVPPVTIDAPATPDVLPVLGSTVGTPIIKVYINGHERYFWLDTGATMSLIASDVAAECGVVPITRDTLAIAAAQGRIAARPAIANTVRIGKITVRNLPVALLDPSALRLDKRLSQGRLVTVKLDGVIGSDVLRRLSVVLDMGAGTIALARPATHPPRQRSLIWIGFPVVRLLTRDGKPVLFGLDTGADSTIVTDAWMDRTPDPGLSPAKGSVDVLGATHTSDLPVLRNVTVGDGEYILRLRGVPIVQERRQTFVALDGVLGADVLAHATLRMDITNGMFSIRAPGTGPLPNDTASVRSH